MGFLFFALCFSVSSDSVALGARLKPGSFVSEHATSLANSTQQGIAPSLVFSIPLRNFENLDYFGDIEIGGRSFSVIFDTGSSYVWVPNTQPASGLAKQLYDNSKSPSHVPDGRPFDFRYASGDVAGHLAKDAISVGQLELPLFTFGEVHETTGLGDVYEEKPFDGVFGLGFEQKLPSVLSSMKGLLREPIVAFYLGQLCQDGEVTFGGVANRYTGDFTFIRLQGGSYWQLRLKSATVFGKDPRGYHPTNMAAIDSGTSFIVGPEGEAIEMLVALGAERYNSTFASDWAISASKYNPDTEVMSFELGGNALGGGTQFPLTLADITVGTVWSEDGHPEKYMLGLMGAQVSGFLLGQVFMRKYYVQFNFEERKVGIAKAIHNGSPCIMDPPQKRIEPTCWLCGATNLKDLLTRPRS